MNQNDSLSGGLDEKIESYLLGELDDETKRTFEEEIEGNPSLKEEVEYQHQIIKGTRLVFHQQRIAEFLEEAKKEEANRKPRIQPFVYYLAASILVLISLWAVINSRFSNLSEKELFAENYLIEDVAFNYHVRGNTDSSLPPKGMESFKEKDYKAANVEFLQHYQQNPASDSLKFLIGITYLELGDQISAISFFQDILTKKNTSEIHLKATWFLALAHLGNEDSESTKAILIEMLEEIEDIQAENTVKQYFKGKAEKLLNLLSD